ncbi:MAG: hypothetical protein P8M72_12955 [Gammaproteobacteria bacterium]|nr:hypothetical protein [Gammaproteobacteria bacterium]
MTILTGGEIVTRTLVLQSYRTDPVPDWIQQCIDSVQSWCNKQNLTWRFIDDDLFDLVPDWYMDKTGKGPIATDYARLVLMQNALATEDVEQVIWLDADIFILDDDMQISSEKSCAFGQEIWIQENQGTIRARKNVHNAVCLFKQGCAVLPFLTETVASIIQRVDPDKIAPQMVGPKLLSALHSLYDFSLLPQVGALSQEVAADIKAGSGPALDLLLEKTSVPLQAVNLCASLMSEVDACAVIAGLPVLQKNK